MVHRGDSGSGLAESVHFWDVIGIPGQGFRVLGGAKAKSFGG